MVYALSRQHAAVAEAHLVIMVQESRDFQRSRRENEETISESGHDPGSLGTPKMWKKFCGEA